MNLFPSIDECRSAINRFPVDESQTLNEIHQHLIANNNGQGLLDVEPKVFRLLRRWRAFRGQPGEKNEHFISALIDNAQFINAFFEVFNATTMASSLNQVLEHSQSIEVIYNAIKGTLLIGEAPARIVAVSKSLLMLAGFTVGFDSRVFERMRLANEYLLTCSGVWPFCLYFETLKFFAGELDTWQETNEPMTNLLPGVPVGQIMDRILWGLI